VSDPNELTEAERLALDAFTGIAQSLADFTTAVLTGTYSFEDAEQRLRDAMRTSLRWAHAAGRAKWRERALASLPATAPVTREALRARVGARLGLKRG
jgi:hypothetical protein